MRDLGGKTAVVTGAASGIGYALAERFASEGMKLVLADVEGPPLEKAEERLRAAGATTLSRVTDVSRWEDVAALAQSAHDTFGAVHVLCNNAGVAGEGAGAPGIWNRKIEDWQWVLGVNLWGVIHGMHAFVPGMVASGEEGHVVNTASMAGLFPGNSIYGVSKHAVVALSEALRSQLRAAEAKVAVSVLCPGVVNTNIFDSARNRPAHLRTNAQRESRRAAEERRRRDRERLASGLPPEQIAEAVVAGIREQRFYLLPMQPELEERFPDAIRRRAERIIGQEEP